MNYPSIVWISIVSIILLSISLGCIDDKGDLTPLDIHISNLTKHNYTVTISIINEINSEIFNETVTIANNSNYRFEDITSKEGTYKLVITLNDGREKEGEIGVNEFRGMVGVSIDVDDIAINQKVQ